MAKKPLFDIGDFVEISSEGLELMRQGFRKKSYPTAHIVGIAGHLHDSGTAGEVIRTEPKMYSCTVDFGSFKLHLKDNWITEA